MDAQIVAGNKDIFIKTVIIKVVEFFLFYVRNIFFIVSAFLIFLVLVIVYIFYQDSLGISLGGAVSDVLMSLPIVGEYMSSPSENIFMDEHDLKNFFFSLSFYFTMCTEIIRYIKIYIFKKKDDGVVWLGRRIVFSLVGISVMYIFSLIYLIAEGIGKDGLFFPIIMMGIFWFVCCVSSVLFIVIDLVAEKVHIVLNRMMSLPIADSERV